MQYSIVKNNTVQTSTVQTSTVQYSTIKYSTVPLILPTAVYYDQKANSHSR